MRETELYAPVKEWLEQAGYEVYAEVSPKYSAHRADVVGKSGNVICIVEMKTSLSMELIEQAIHWTTHAHYVYIAIPARKKDIPHFVDRILRNHRIGILQVGNGYVRRHSAARFNRPALKLDWSKELLPEHQTWVEGGHAGGGYVTPYKLTINKVKRFLSRQKDWVDMNTILSHCETHYSSPKPSLSKALRDFEHNWCLVEKRKGKLWFKHK